MAILKDTEREQLRQLVKACLLEISKLKIDLKKCQKESSRSIIHEHGKLQELQAEQEKKLHKKEDEINEFVNLLEEKDLQIKELEKVKNQFKLLIQKPKKDLTSFQSNIYLLLPYKEDTLENLYDSIIALGFNELTHQNFEHALRNLERKGYFRSREDNGVILWKKVEKD
jgi:cell division protein FtsL